MMKHHDAPGRCAACQRVCVREQLLRLPRLDCARRRRARARPRHDTCLFMAAATIGGLRCLFTCDAPAARLHVFTLPCLNIAELKSHRGGSVEQWDCFSFSFSFLSCTVHTNRCLSKWFTFWLTDLHKKWNNVKNPIKLSNAKRQKTAFKT